MAPKKLLKWSGKAVHGPVSKARPPPPKDKPPAETDPPFSALALVFSEYYMNSPLSSLQDLPLVNKTFKEAVDAARKLRGDQTWHLHSGCLYSGGLHRLLDWLSAHDEGLKRVKVDGSGVTMEYHDWQLLLEALGARAWEQISLMDVNFSGDLRLRDFLKTSAERGTLRHLSISDSMIWRHDLEAGLATTSHCLETLEILAGVRFLDARPGKEGPFCRSLKKLVLTASGYQYRSSNNLWLP